MKVSASKFRNLEVKNRSSKHSFASAPLAPIIKIKLKKK